MNILPCEYIYVNPCSIGSGPKSTICVRGPCGQANVWLCFGPGEPLGRPSCGDRPRGRVERGRVGGDSNLLGRQRPQVPMISNAPSGFNALTAAAPRLGRTDSLHNRPEAQDSRCQGGQCRRVARPSGHQKPQGSAFLRDFENMSFNEYAAKLARDSTYTSPGRDNDCQDGD